MKSVCNNVDGSMIDVVFIFVVGSGGFSGGCNCELCICIKFDLVIIVE